MRNDKRKKILLFIVALFFVSCTTAGRHVGDTWGDASLVTEQRIEIEQQQQLIINLERIIQRGAEHLRAAEERLGNLEGRNFYFEDWLQRVDQFVRAVIRVQRELEEVQLSNSGADAGER